MIEDVIRKGALLDVYGALLTEKQRNCMELYFMSDWSLAEIASSLHISRQAVHDNLHRAGQALEEYEAKLHIVEKRERQRQLLQEAKELLAGETLIRQKEIGELLARIQREIGE